MKIKDVIRTADDSWLAEFLCDMVVALNRLPIGLLSDEERVEFFLKYLEKDVNVTEKSK